MLFNSSEFLFFFPVIYLLYWVLSKHRVYQNVLLIVASYIFYGFWDWRFLILLSFSSLLDFTTAFYMGKTNSPSARKKLLYISLIGQLGILGFFKYFNFFIENFKSLFSPFGLTADFFTFHVLLPVGISFYTFQTLSYVIDVYRKKMEPTKDIISFFSFVSFFPQLVAGPIERAYNMLPQFARERKFKADDFKDGMRLIIAGYFKKMVIADNACLTVDHIFDSHQYNHGLVLILGSFLFAFQIYGDFSGYTDIARGLARMLGFYLSMNFFYPYFSKSITEFWHRWHISLSTWFRDYVYISMGGNRKGKTRTDINLITTFTLSGLWHGANWTFIIWGFINGIYLVIEKAIGRTKKIFSFPRKISSALKLILTFILINITWIFFRSRNITDAFNYLKGIFSSLIEPKAFSFLHEELFPKGYIAIFLILILVSLEWINRAHAHFLDITHLPRMRRIATYFFVLLIILMFGSFFDIHEFIYFQF